MRKHSRWSYLIIFFIFCLLTMFLPGCTNAPNPPIQVHFNTGDYYTFEGWGTSLAWWADAIGNWQNAKERSALEDALFNVDNGLGLNIIRYNFGANADTNQCSKSFRSHGSIDSFEPSNGSWDWTTKDQAQLRVLKEAQTIIGTSHTSAIFEGFANSAPAWMLMNHCTQGNGGGNNLNPVYEQNYAQYLATIVQHFHDDPGFGNITFRTVDPFNEPDLPWSGSQEGMHVDLKQQEAVIGDLHAALPTYTSISAPDDNNIVNTICSYKNSPGCTYQKDEEPYNVVIQNDIYQLNTHSYNGNDDDRVGFSSLTHRPERQAKPAWMSEYTTNGTDNLGPKCSISADHAMLGALQLSCQITRDLSFMRPTAWVYWQAVDSGGFGLLQTSDGNLATESFDKTKQYYALWQYSHFIRPGDQIIEGGFNSDSLAAMDPMSHKLVIVTTNIQSTNEEVTYDLSNFSSTPGSVTAYTTTAETSSTHPPTRSSPTLHGKQFSTTLPGGSITTFVIPTTSTALPPKIKLSVVKDIGSQASPSTKWDIEYPQITGLPDQAVETAINTRLRESPESFKTEFLSGLAKYPPAPGAGLSEIDMTVAGSYLTPRLLSTGYSGYEYEAGAAHGINLDASLNFDLTNGKVLTNRDLVNPGAPGSGDQGKNLEALKEAVSQLVQSQLGSDSGCVVDQTKLIGAPDDPSPLFFTSQGAMIGYPNYTFGANPCGFPPALIPYTKLTGILNPVYFPRS